MNEKSTQASNLKIINVTAQSAIYNFFAFDSNFQIMGNPRH
jgi:hypothetical protein